MPTREPSGPPPDGNVLLTIGQHMATISSQLETNSQKSEGNGRKLDRLGWHVTQNTLRLADMHQSLISALQSLKTSTRTTEPFTSTGTSIATPTTDTAPTHSWWRAVSHVSAWGPKVLMWLAEKTLTYLMPTLLSIGLGAWALLRRHGEAVWNWLGALWTSVVG